MHKSLIPTVFSLRYIQTLKKSSRLSMIEIHCLNLILWPTKKKILLILSQFVLITKRFIIFSETFLMFLKYCFIYLSLNNFSQ